MVGGGNGKTVAENMRSRLLTKGGKFMTKEVDSQLPLSIGRWVGPLPCTAMVKPRQNELISRIRSFHSAQILSSDVQLSK